MPRSAAAGFPPPVLITTTEELEKLCWRLREEAFVTVDTEFMRERTYWPELCVVQLASDTEVAVVDAEAPGMDLAALGLLLADQNVLKVFHAARQDIEIFVLKFGDVPRPLFDTQIAAMVAGFGDQVGYDALVSGLTGGSIDKAHRFSDWTARPLSFMKVRGFTSRTVRPGASGQRAISASCGRDFCQARPSARASASTTAKPALWRVDAYSRPGLPKPSTSEMDMTQRTAGDPCRWL